MKKILTWTAFILSTCAFTVYLYGLDPSTPFQAFFTACMCGGIVALIVPCIYQIIWRHDNGVDLFATLETDPEKVKAHMLHVMQWGHHQGLKGALSEFNDIFRNYPQWELWDWEVFRAWYKAEIDHMLKSPDIYKLTLKADGSPYSKDDDPLYDPDAPDWAQFDRPHDDDDDDTDDDDYDRHDRNRRETDDALAVGVGVGIVDGLTGGPLSGG